MKITYFLLSLLLPATVLADKPNIVFILADDMRVGEKIASTTRPAILTTT